MLDTPENIEETEKMWRELCKDYGSTETMYMSSKFDYLDNEGEDVVKLEITEAELIEKIKRGGTYRMMQI